MEASDFTLILLLKDKPIGTGFLIHADGLVATCYHVIKNAFGILSPGEMVNWRMLHGNEGNAIVTRQYDEREDVVLLRIAGAVPPNLKPVPLIESKAAAPHTPFFLSGYGEIKDSHHRYDISSAAGKIVGQTQRDGVNMLHLESKQILQGMSGGAIYCDSIGGAVGLLSARYTIDPKSQLWLRDTGWAARSEAIAALDKSLEPIPPVVSTSKRESNVQRFNAQDMRFIQAENYVETKETGIKLNLKLNWKRPDEYDPQRRWLNAISRKELLEQIENTLNPKEPEVASVALVGTPGAGKSTVASLYVNKYGKNYPGGVLWVEMGPNFDPSQAVQPILDRWASWCYGDDSFLLRQSGEWQQLVFDASVVKSLLSNHGEMLVIFDDVWKADDLRPLLEALPAESNLLITTRDRKIAHDYTTLPVDELPPDEALQMLQQHLKNVSAELLEKMATQLSYHAQALRLVTDALVLRADHEQAVLDFLQQIKQGTSQILSESDDFNSAFNFSYQILDETACYRLRQLGVLAPIDKNFTTEMAAALWNISSAEGQKVLEDFHRRSLVLLVSSTNTTASVQNWSIHALVAENLENMLQSKGELTKARDRHINYIMKLRTDGFTNSVDIPHVLWVGHRIVEKVEDMLGFELKSVNGNAVTIPSLNDEETDFLREFAEFIAATLNWLLTRPECRGFGQRWLSALRMAGIVLGDSEITATSLLALARWDMRDGKLEDALSLLEQVQELSKTDTNVQIKGWGLNLMGIVYQLKGDTEHALNCFESAFTIASENDLELAAHSLVNHSGLLLTINEIEKASENLNRLLPIMDNLDDFYLKQKLMQQLGMLQVTNNNVDEALKLFETVREGAVRRNEPEIVAEIEDNIGCAHYIAGKLELAEEHFQKALTGAEETQSQRLKAICLRDLGAVEYARGNLKDARELLQESLDIFDEYPDKHNSVFARTLIGEVYFQLGDIEQALGILRDTLPELHSSYNTVSAVYLLNTIGTIYQRTGRIEEGLTFFQDTLPIIEELNYRGAEVTIFNWLSILLQDVGNIQQAMYYFERAKEIIDKIESNEERATALTLFASLYRIFGELREAYETQKKAVDLWSSVNNVLKLTESLVLLAVLEWQRGEIDAAQRTLNKAKELINEKIPTQALAEYYNIQGLVYLQLERIDAAAEQFELSAQVNKEVNNPILRISNLNNLSMIHIARSELESSEKLIKEAIELADEITWVPLQVTTRTNLAFLMYLRGDTETSVKHFNEAIKMLDENSLTADAAGQTVDMLRAFVRIIKDQKDTPEESLQLLLQATTWDGIVMILNARKHILLESAIDKVLSQAIRAAEKRGEILFAQVMRLYRILLDKCRAKDLESTLRRERATFVDTTIELWWGYLHRRNRQYTAALKHFNHVLQNDPENQIALIERGWIYSRLGRYEQALNDFRRVDKLQNSDSLSLQGMGVAQFEMGQPAESLATLTRALQSQEEPYTYQWRAAVNQSLGDLPAAIADLDKAIELDRRCSDHHYWRSLVYLESDEFKKALSDLNFVIEMEVEDPARLVYAYFWRGISHHLNGNKPEAAADWAQSRAYLKSAVEPVAHWCYPLLLFVEESNWEQAKESYTHLLTLPFANSVVLAQLRNLKLLQHIYPQKETIKTAMSWLSRNRSGSNGFCSQSD